CLQTSWNQILQDFHLGRFKDIIDMLCVFPFELIQIYRKESLFGYDLRSSIHKAVVDNLYPIKLPVGKAVKQVLCKLKYRNAIQVLKNFLVAIVIHITQARK